jgi:hypothetical protein
MPKMYRTAQGRVVDFEAMQLKNENVIAVGNMRVNARGDELGPGGEVTKTNNQRVAEHYATYSTVPTDPGTPTIEESLPDMNADKQKKKGTPNV